MTPSNKAEAEKFPSVELAYPIALDSYRLAAERFDALDSRIQAILTLGMSLTLAAPIAFSALKLTIAPRLFAVAIVFFVLALAIGTVARLWGALTVLTPRTLFEKYLRFSEWEFKKDIVYFAGEHFDKNKGLLARKHKLLVAVTTALFLEILFLVLSVSFHP